MALFEEKLILAHGWSPVPRDLDVLLGGKSCIRQPRPITVDEIPLPKTELVEKVTEYVKKELREETFNHSMRVYHYGAQTPPAVQKRHGSRSGAILQWRGSRASDTCMLARPSNKN